MTLRGILPPRRVALLAAATAALLFVAYPPASLVLPGFVCLVPFLWWLEEESGDGSQVPGGASPAPRYPPPGAFWPGFWFGVIVNGTVLYWMVVALWHFTPLSFLGYVASLGLVLGPLWGGLAVAVVRVRRRTAIPAWVAFPLLWTALEWLIAHLSDLRFPWLGLGTSLTRAPVLVQWADLAGARGVTLWLAWANVMVLLALRRRAWRPAALLAASLAAAVGYGVWRQRTLAMRPALHVAVIQPNVDYELKRRDRSNDSLVTAMIGHSVEAARLDSTARLIVWPEAVVPDFFFRHPHWEPWIGDAARRLRTPILAGGLDLVWDSARTYEYYNAAFLFDTTGSRHTAPVYHKRYLVPIVERVPFINPRWLHLPYFGGFGVGRAFPVYRVDGAGFGVLICYESAFEDLGRRYRRDGADFLVNITNDSWYGRTAAPYQHAAHLVMRAIETRMGIARSASTGISQFVDPLGRTHQSTALYVEAIETRTVLTTDGRTLYVRLGDWVGLVALVGAAACLVAAHRRRTATGESA